MAFRIQVLLFISALLSVAFLVAGLYLENKYLSESELRLLNTSTRNFLCSTLIITLLLLIATEFSIIPEARSSSTFLLGVFVVIAILDLISLFYGILFIDKNMNNYRSQWMDTNNEKQITEIEKTLKCCGFDDPLMSAAKKCIFKSDPSQKLAGGTEQTCGEIIKNEIPYRKTSLIVFTVAALLFDIYGIKVVSQLNNGSKNSGKISEFEDLIEAVE